MSHHQRGYKYLKLRRKTGLENRVCSLKKDEKQEQRSGIEAFEEELLTKTRHAMEVRGIKSRIRFNTLHN